MTVFSCRRSRRPKRACGEEAGALRGADRATEIPTKFLPRRNRPDLRLTFYDV
jgi:hypothetical protein